MNKVIFDPIITGHHLEFLWNLVKVQNKYDNQFKTYFITGFGFETKAKKEYGDFDMIGSNYEVIEISKKESKFIGNKNIHLRHFFHFFVMLKYILKCKVKKVIVLDLNQVLKGLILILNLINFEISGVLFNGNKFIELNGFRFKLFFKVFSNRNIRKVFVLNGESLVNELNAKFKINKFRSLPDPLPEIDLNEFTCYTNNKIILLYVGSVTKRKGIDLILESLKKINFHTSKLYELRIFGRVEDNIKSYVKDSINEISNKNDLNIVYEPSFVSHFTFISQIINCDYVLALYKDTEISSGILGYSILFNKLLIGSNSGFIGSKYLKEWNGYSITPDGDELIKLLNQPLKKTKSSLNLNLNYMKKHSYARFSRILDE